MCPLRYILLLLSLLVAMIGFTQALAEQDKQLTQSFPVVEEEEEESQQQQQASETSGRRQLSGRKPAQSTMRTLVDMLNGKYLYDAWKNSQLRVKTA